MNNNINTNQQPPFQQQPPFGRPPFQQQPPFGRPPFGPPPFQQPPPFEQPQAPFAVDPGAIRFCLYRFTNVELIDGRRFVFYPVFVGPRSVAGWQFIAYRWRFIGIDLFEIRLFSCF